MIIKKIKPMFTALVTTMDRYETDAVLASGLIDPNKRQGALKEYQTVVAVGSTVREIKVGDLVWINPKRFGITKHREGTLKDNIVTDNPIIEYRFDTVKLNGKDHLLLEDRDIEFVLEEFEEEVEVPVSPIIHPAKPTIILNHDKDKFVN